MDVAGGFFMGAELAILEVVTQGLKVVTARPSRQ